MYPQAQKPIPAEQSPPAGGEERRRGLFFGTSRDIKKKKTAENFFFFCFPPSNNTSQHTPMGPVIFLRVCSFPGRDNGREVFSAFAPKSHKRHV